MGGSTHQLQPEGNKPLSLTIIRNYSSSWVDQLQLEGEQVRGRGPKHPLCQGAWLCRLWSWPSESLEAVMISGRLKRRFFMKLQLVSPVLFDTDEAMLVDLPGRLSKPLPPLSSEAFFGRPAGFRTEGRSSNRLVAGLMFCDYPQVLWETPGSWVLPRGLLDPAQLQDVAGLMCFR